MTLWKQSFLELSKLQERAWGETVQLSSAELKSRRPCVWIKGNSKHWCFKPRQLWMGLNGCARLQRKQKCVKKQPWHWLKWRRWWWTATDSVCYITNMLLSEMQLYKQYAAVKMKSESTAFKIYFIVIYILKWPKRWMKNIATKYDYKQHTDDSVIHTVLGWHYRDLMLVLH